MTHRDDTEMRRAVRRLALQFTALIAVLFVLLGTLVFWLVSRSASDALDRTLRDAAQVDSPRDLPPGMWVTNIDSDGDPTIASDDLPEGLPDTDALRRVAADGRALQTQVSEDGRTYRVFTTAQHGHLIQVATDGHESSEELARLAWALVGAGAVALIVSAVAATWMARIAIRPLGDALALQRRFVADASHELRTPLTLLSTRAQLLRRRVPVEDASSALGTGLDEIVQDARDLTATLEDLLVAADPREISSFTPVDLSALARAVVEDYREQAEERGIALAPPSGSSAVTVSGAAPALQRMLVALIVNALDHARSLIAVSVAIDGKQASVTVSDDGPGFPPELTDRAFERFATSRPADDAPAGQRHYGLGLALVADVAHRHGGSVGIAPRSPAGGASITVRLPLP